MEITVHWIENPRWKEPNGVSVLAGEAEIEGAGSRSKVASEAVQAAQALATRSGGVRKCQGGGGRLGGKQAGTGGIDG